MRSNWRTSRIFMSGFAADLGDAQPDPENTWEFCINHLRLISLVESCSGQPKCAKKVRRVALRSLSLPTCIGPEDEETPAVSTSPLWSDPLHHFPPSLPGRRASAQWFFGNSELPRATPAVAFCASSILAAVPIPIFRVIAFLLFLQPR